jgi:hypothetical protein
MKKARVKRVSKAKPKARKDAWAAAEAYGCDMNLLEISLRRTPAERIDAHQSALDLFEAIREAGKRRNVRS